MASDNKRFISRNNNSNSGTVSIGSGSSVTILTANELRTAVCISNAGNQNLILEFDDGLGTFTEAVLIAPNKCWVMPDGAIYTGEIRGIMIMGGLKDVIYLEY